IRFVCQLDPSAQHFADAPSLRNTSLRGKRRVSVENLAERAEPIALNRGPERLKKTHRRHAVGVNPLCWRIIGFTPTAWRRCCASTKGPSSQTQTVPW